MKAVQGVLLGAALLLMAGVVIAQTPDNGLPAFELWVECVERGVYPGQAYANVGYRYDGAFTVTAEDARLFGDTSTGETIIAPLTIEPGEYPRFVRWNVGANKVVTWKVVLFDKLHVVTAWDDPQVADCPVGTPTPMPTGTATSPDI